MDDTQEAYARYGDILRLPHPVSGKHKPMGRLERAAQFSPFAALTGYDDAIDEAARYTDEQPILSEEQRLEIGIRLHRIQTELPNHPIVMIRYFRPDGSKPGGAILTVTEAVRKIRTEERKLLMENGLELCFDSLLSIDGDLFDDQPDCSETF